MGKRLKKKKVGVLHLAGEIQVTDPCYDSDVWCRTKINVKEGDYTCRIWRDADEDVFSTVRIIGIYLNDIIPQAKAMEEIAEIGVDAGLAGFFSEKPDYSDDEWSAFCDEKRSPENANKEAWIFNNILKTTGFFSYSGYGDGCYPIYVWKNRDGEIIAAEIRF